LATYTRPSCSATLTGWTPREETTPCGTSSSAPFDVIRSTDIWLLPASTAITKRPSPLTWIDPWQGKPEPVPSPPVSNGEPGRGLSCPSSRRTKPATVFVPAVLSFT
jgi:hypothetical protein